MRIFSKIKKYIRIVRSGTYVIACAIGYFLNKYFPEEPKKSFAEKQWDKMCSPEENRSFYLRFPYFRDLITQQNKSDNHHQNF